MKIEATKPRELHLNTDMSSFLQAFGKERITEDLDLPHIPQRELTNDVGVLALGFLAGRILIGNLVENRAGSIAELDTPSKSATVILGKAGYLGVIDHQAKIILNFKNGSEGEFYSFGEIYEENYAPRMGYRVYEVDFKSTGLQLIQSLDIASTIQEATLGKLNPECRLRVNGSSELNERDKSYRSFDSLLKAPPEWAEVAEENGLLCLKLNWKYQQADAIDSNRIPPKLKPIKI